MRMPLYPFATALELLMLVAALVLVVMSSIVGCVYKALDNASGWLCAKAKLLPDAKWYLKRGIREDGR